MTLECIQINKRHQWFLAIGSPSYRNRNSGHRKRKSFLVKSLVFLVRC